MLIFGHRGAPGFPRRGENTIASFDKALAAGVHGIEFDVRRCGDGQLVVIHEPVIRRNSVAGLSHTKLQRLGPVPLLAEVLNRYGGKCILNIEMKEAGIAGDVKEQIESLHLETGVIVSCFEWAELQPLAGTIPIGLLATEPAGLLAAAREVGAAAIHPRRDIVRPDLVAQAREQGLRVHVWTVNNPREVEHFRNIGVDAILTDFPERCLTSAS